MKLTRFRVTYFRSVEDSGWIDTTDITALIGENESGKTNLLTPLWKLNPANNEPIDLIADAPRGRYHQIRNTEKKPVFIQADFLLDDALVQRIVALTGVTADEVRTARVSRTLDGTYIVDFPDALLSRTVSQAQIAHLLQTAHDAITAIAPTAAGETTFRDQVLTSIQQRQSTLATMKDDVPATALVALIQALPVPAESSKRSQVAPRFAELQDELQTLQAAVNQPHPSANVEARELVRASLPSFVYYSDYGNLDSEIYLPYVINNMQRTDLGMREQAKVRTLKVLFDFVRLSPQEILELGQEPDQRYTQLTEQQIETVAEQKKERSILLQAASTELTKQFRAWWKQGDYVFRFEVDGNHFRIWVSDDRRPEPIELEGRSRGLQWFFSFYLVFLVESQLAHKGAILLLDEPGLSLHPIAQENLSRFFDNLANKNQILYTTHSPFLVEPDHLDRVKAVYIDAQGHTAVSADLRANEDASNRSIYPVYAALNLSVSQTLLQGCTLVLVEGPSDQFYLSAIKILLISAGRLKPQRELVFLAVGGVRGVSPVTSILVGRDARLPYVLLDSDKVGMDMAKHLRDQAYIETRDRVLTIDTFTQRTGDEIEDLFPQTLLARIIGRQMPRTEDEFGDVIDATKTFVPQVRAFADANHVTLATGWKVEVARTVKERLLSGREHIDEQRLDMWTAVFSAMSSRD